MSAQVTLVFETRNADDQTHATTTIQGTVPEVFDAIEQLYGAPRVNEARREWGLRPTPTSDASGQQ